MPLQPLNLGRVPRQAYAPRTHQAFPYPAPTKGIDVLNPLSASPPDTALVLSNCIPRSFGVEFRAGWKSWSSLIPGEIRTIMPYNPPRGTGVPVGGKLFAACSNGSIYDITAQTNESTVPPVAVAITGQVEPGEFSWTNFATASTNYLCICSSGGGYWTYDSVGGWVDRTSAISGAGSAAAISFDFILSWKNRLWFVADQTADTYFLGVNSISGASSNFDFGPLLVNGGDVKAMASWTTDAGNALDDKLVIVGSEGDVLIYEGTDPSAAATFRIVGRWFIGRPPNGRRFLDRYGGDLAMITQYGLIYMSKLLAQKELSATTVGNNAAVGAYTINPLLGAFVRETLFKQYWEVRYFPPLQIMYINAPDGIEVKDRQFVLDVNTGGWSTFDGIPMLTCELYQGEMYFGTVDGKIGKAFEKEVESDGLSTTGTAGKDIEVKCQTAFVPGGEGMRYKRMLQAQLTFQSQTPPDIFAQVNVDWKFESTPGSPAFISSPPPLWDVALWDVAVWDVSGSGQMTTFRAWIGAVGLGYYASLRWTGKGRPGTLFMNWLLVTESGGIM
jgi:hypothetical protein